MASVPETQHAPEPSLNAAWVDAIVAALEAAGVRRAVLCPGGRASAMCLALDRHARIAVEMVSSDERSGAFVALGLAKASGEPVALVTTSGSAIANALPALIEAEACDIALVAITCDRPRSLRGASFGQMADHCGATRAFVRAQVDLDDPRDTPEAVHAMRANVAQVLRAMLGQRDDATDTPRADALPSPHRRTRGPVHLNVPLAGVYDAMEVSGVSAQTWAVAMQPWHDSGFAQDADNGEHEIESAVARVLARARERHASQSPAGVAGMAGLIVVGAEPAVPLDAILALASVTGFPVVADAASGLRAQPGALSPEAAARGEPGALVVNAFDVFGTARLADARPDLVIRFGLAPVLPALHAWFEQHGDAPTLRVAPSRIACDYLHPGLDPRDVLVAPNRATLDALARALSNAVSNAAQATTRTGQAVAWRWRERWASVAAYSARERRACVRSLAWGEVAAVHRVLDAPGFDFVHVGNSMAVRHADIGCDVRNNNQVFYTNRGVSGIDGTIATFLGEALARRDAGLLMIGDQAFVHDLGALALAQRIESPACICIVDNGGGAIFDFLPVAREPGFRRAIRNPYALRFAALAQGFGLAYRRVDNRDALDAALNAARTHAGVTLVELAVDAHSGAAQMQQLVRAVGGA
ncbi:2-succinyl-5-enolpyruvyl-6-hydroxy-3-cyclohexene-1-carboxylic-acid synthase [Paraburkholderia tropica]|uniref:2-succinyl-5-enolpyruvyl-6-hydroxy-3- cyclohexene-1-carboxylic-acid synthase n=1 Tax=Paraburkholderia tropica TaxID=92647 RepID=UPI0015908629|nr:2-succinyl-5-enolpyruvyl-6-hydroxy-3-cyclohexene-1-carboxylic-acid synthase [Paraburkholderia tropica]